MATKIITGMRFIDIKQRRFIVTDTFLTAETESKISAVMQTVENYRIHFKGSLRESKLTQIGFKQIGLKDSQLIIRSINQMEELIDNNLIMFY